MLKEFRNYLIVFLLLGLSGMPFFSGRDIFLIATAGLFVGFAILERDLAVHKEVVIVLVSALILVFCQAFIFSFFKLTTVIGLILKIAVAFLAVKLLKEQFVNYFLKLMAFFCLFSFLVFIPIFISPGLENTLMNAMPSFLSYEYYEMGIGQVSKRTMILFEFNTQMINNSRHLVRNCGPFWEPGAYGGFLLIALILNTVREQRFSTRLNWLFIATIISTQSTTAFMALFAFVIIVFLIFQRTRVPLKLLIVAVLVVGTVVAFQSLYFLKSKIQKEAAGLEEAMEQGGDTRLASAALDWQDIRRFPFTGRGMWDETRIDDKFEAVMRNNGFTNLIARWGFIFFAIYFYWYYKGFEQYCRIYEANKYMPLALLCIIWLIGMSQDYFESPFFISLAFLYTPYRDVTLGRVVKGVRLAPQETELMSTTDENRLVRT